jgi:RNA polymerase sigma-70 factor (ECF subfamily)
MASPDAAASDEFARHRVFLRLLIRMQMRPEDYGRIDPSDVVQEALLAAHEHREQYCGTTPQEYEAWLRRILANKLADSRRRLGRQPLNLDDLLCAALDESSARIDKLLGGAGESTGEQAIRRERLVRLEAALEQLPPDWREVVVRKHLHGESVPAIAAATGRTTGAVAGLLRRGMRRLRELMGETSQR